MTDETPKKDGSGAPDADSVRRELRDLGYLQNPLESFVAGRITGTTGLIRTAVLVGTRVGAIGGLLLGLLAAAGLLLLQPDLLRVPLDAVIVTVNVVVIFAIVSMGVGIVGVIVLLLVHRATRRFVGLTRATAQGSGIVAGVLAFVYLALLYRKLAVDLPPVVPVAAALLVLVASLVFGRMIAAGAYVFLVRLAGGRPSPSERRAGVLVAVLSVLGVAGFFLYLGVTAPRDVDEPPSDRVEVRATGERILIVAVDGPTTEFARASVESDRLPNVRRLLQSGSSGVLDAEDDDIAPSFWTSVATGRTSAEHGVRRYSDRKILGMKSTIVAPETVGFHELLDALVPRLPLTREVPLGTLGGGPRTIFDVAGESGLPVGVVNWRRSWPAAELPGFVVSDVTYFSILKRRASAAGAGSSVDTYPASLLAEVEPLAHDPASFDLAGIEDVSGQRLFGGGDLSDPRRENVSKSVCVDEFACATALRVLGSRKPDLVAVYMPGFALLQHAILPLSLSSASDLRAAAETMEAYERFVDDRLGRLQAAMGAGSTVLLLTFPDAKEHDGLLLLSGPAARRGTTCGPATALDVAPTCLALLGLPASGEMKGRVIQEALTPEFVKANPERRIRSFGAKPRRKLPPGVSDENLGFDRMKAVGYVR
ncbi:MAG: alkaline phosphatase family protein [Planctomycetes bacterium]|nr:alkaline phosphatase family protein [Planctomycetota bacterium]MBI3847390.1 alkaline phosphatase family protein [Planctomycetota bacterium]